MDETSALAQSKHWRECYLFIIISLFHPRVILGAGHDSSSLIDEDMKTLREIRQLLTQSSSCSIKPHTASQRLTHFFLSAYWILIAFDCQACFISHQNYSFILPSSVLGGVKWYLEITHKTLETLLFTFSTLTNKFLKLQSRYQNQKYKAIHIPPWTLPCNCTVQNLMITLFSLANIYCIFIYL